MKLAITYDNGQVFQHFGKTEAFKIYDIVEGKVGASMVMSTNGQGHGALAGLLRGLGISVLICGGIGPGAQDALASLDITVIPGITGDVDQAVQDFVDGKLVPTTWALPTTVGPTAAAPAAATATKGSCYLIRKETPVPGKENGSWGRGFLVKRGPSPREVPGARKFYSEKK